MHDVNEVVRPNVLLDVEAGNEHVNILWLKIDTGNQGGSWGSEAGYA